MTLSSDRVDHVTGEVGLVVERSQRFHLSVYAIQDCNAENTESQKQNSNQEETSEQLDVY